MSRIIL